MIHLIAAVDRNGGIGKDNDLLCHISADLKRFKYLTMGHTMLMGRKTFESLPHALPNRTNVVLSSQPKERFPGCEVYTSLPEALAQCQAEEEVFIIGGGQVYQQAIQLADRLYITRIHHLFDKANIFFPAFDATEWDEVGCEEHEADEKNPYPYTYINYRRKRVS